MGRVFKPKYAWTKADGTRVEKVTEAWYIEYADASGRWIRRKAGLTKEDAKDALRKAEGDVLAEKNGLDVVKPSTRLCRDLFAAYLAAQKERVSPDYYRDLGARVNAFLRGCQFTTAKDIDSCRADEYLNRIQQERQLSARTVNKIITMVKGWLRWCVRARLLPYNPLDAISGRKGAFKHQRRPLTEKEIGRLLAVALEGPMRRARHKYAGGTKKPGRVPLPRQEALARKGRGIVLAYRLMLTAGLRLHEARLLRWVDVDLGTGLLFVQGDKGDKLRGTLTRKEIPIPPETVAALEHWKVECGHAADTDRVVYIPGKFITTLDDDLHAADIPKRDALNRVVDCHALRHTYGNLLIASGADIKTCQSLMRHATAALTLAIYIHSDKGRMRAAASALPSLRPTLPVVPPQCAPVAESQPAAS